MVNPGDRRCGAGRRGAGAYAACLGMAGLQDARPGRVDRPGAAAGHRDLPGRRIVGHRRGGAGRPDAGRSCHRPGRGAESPDRGLRAAAPRHLRHPWRRHRSPGSASPWRAPSRPARRSPRQRTFAPPGGRRCGTPRPRGWSASPPRPWGRCWWSMPSRRLLRRRPTAHRDPDHRRGAGAGSRPAGCGPGARAGPPGRPSPPAAGRGADRPPGAAVPAADAGRRPAGSPAG